MKRDVHKTPEKSNRVEGHQSKTQKSSGFMSDSSVMKFFNDVKDGEVESFDVTTASGFIKELLTRIKKVDVTGLGSQVAFFFLLSMFPLLIFIFTLLPYLNLDQEQILIFIRDFAPASVALLIEDTLGEVFNNRNSGLLSIGAIATVWSASKGMNALTKALNRSYFKEETRPFLISRGMSVVFTIMLIAVLVIALVLPIFGQQIGMIVFSYLGLEHNFVQIWNSFRWVFPLVLIFLVFTVIYWVVPNLKLHIKSVFPGAAFATIGWIITSLGFSFYVSSYGNYSNTYGSIGGIIVLMMWLYFSSIILMLGGQINAVMDERKNSIQAKIKSKAVG
ncbi:YihY/virulence factor BrkB family protein [Sporosarcina siberiensis]|uniref:YihY/virulence factor BrkB family protein n=1 Tax=Sporosarcina siberiensis TaxID=1365606 RepID=A0ABW4SEW5_9BACL